MSATRPASALDRQAIFACCALLLLLLSLTATAQEAVPSAPPPPVTIPIIEGRMQAAQENSALDEATKARIAEIYTQALEQLRIAEEWRVKAAGFEKQRTEAPEKITAIQQELLAPPAPMPDLPAEDVSAQALEAVVTAADNDEAAANAKLTELMNDAALRTERRRLIPELQSNARQRLEDVRSQLAAPAVQGESAELVEARRLLGEARRLLIDQELQAYDQELQSYDARGKLITYRIDQAKIELDQKKQYATNLRDLLKERQQQEAFQVVRTVRNPELYRKLEENGAPPAIVELANELKEEVIDLNRERTGPDGMLKKIEAKDNRLKEVNDQLTTLASEFTTLKTKVEAAGSSSVVGVLLRSHRRNLDDERQLKQTVAKRQQDIAGIQIEQINTEGTSPRIL